MVVVVSLGGAAVALTAAAGGRRAEVTLARDAPLQSDELGADGRGAATAMWTTLKLVGPLHETETEIHVRQQDTGGDWSTGRTVGATADIDEAHLVVAARGAAAIVWEQSGAGRSGQGTALMAVTRATAAGRWSTPKTIWLAADATALSFATSIDATGEVTVAWVGYRGVDPPIRVANLDAADGTIGAPQRVVAPGSAGAGLSLAQSPGGAAVMSWTRTLPGRVRRATGPSQRNEEMASLRTSATGRWSAPRPLGTFLLPDAPASSTAWSPASPSDVVTANGTAAVAWTVPGHGSENRLRISSHRPGSARWSISSPVGSSVDAVGLAAGPDDSLVAVWTPGPVRDPSPLAAASPDGTHWGATTRLTGPAEGVGEPFIASAADGRVALVGAGASGGAIEDATRTPAGRWSRLTRFGTGGEPEMTVASDGTRTVVWESDARGGRLTLHVLTTR